LVTVFQPLTDISCRALNDRLLRPAPSKGLAILQIYLLDHQAC
jgi:hypothetical protein